MSLKLYPTEETCIATKLVGDRRYSKSYGLTKLLIFIIGLDSVEKMIFDNRL